MMLKNDDSNIDNLFQETMSSILGEDESRSFDDESEVVLLLYKIT